MAIPFPLRSQITTHTRVLNLLRNNYCESEFWILILDRGLSENTNLFSPEFTMLTGMSSNLHARIHVVFSGRETRRLQFLRFYSLLKKSTKHELIGNTDNSMNIIHVFKLG